MAAAHDYITEVYAKLLKLASDRPEFVNLVRGGNIVDFSQKQPFPKPAGAGDAGFPAAYLYCKSGTDDLFSGSPTFDTQSATFAPAAGEWAETMTPVYLLRIVGPDARVGPVNQILQEFLTAVRQAGPRLGLNYPLLGKITWTCQTTSKLPECQKRDRFIADVSIPVDLVFEGATELIS